MQRSFKYQKLSDDEVLDLFVEGVDAPDEHYLVLELVKRGLVAKAEKNKAEAAKKSLFGSKKFIFTVVALCFLLLGYLERYV